MRIRIHFKWMVGGSIDEWPSYVVPCSILARRRCYQKITIDLPFCQRRRRLRFSFRRAAAKEEEKEVDGRAKCHWDIWIVNPDLQSD